MNINNINELENYFEQNPSSNLFPILSEYYLSSKKIEKAENICKKGLEFNPNSLDGLYTLSRILTLKKEYFTSEKILKKIIKQDPKFFNAYIVLSQIYWIQNEIFKLKKILKQLLVFNTKNIYAIEGLKKISKLTLNKQKKFPKKKVEESFSKTNSNIKLINDKNINSIPITKNIATFTMVEIFKSQKLYKEALGVLSVMKTKKNSDVKEIKIKQTELIELLKNLNNNK